MDLGLGEDDEYGVGGKDALGGDSSDEDLGVGGIGEGGSTEDGSDEAGGGWRLCIGVGILALCAVLHCIA
jgi:hypothetical protein